MVTRKHSKIFQSITTSKEYGGRNPCRVWFIHSNCLPGCLFARPLAALDYLFIFVSSLNNLMNKQSEKQNIKCDCHLVRWCILMAYFTTFIIYLL